ncbi:MAG: 5-oxoprolinase subunit PxpA [Gemmatales bacterium]|nr:5-oxoprolinase subunit PxpA [Gemmatales bacterium]MDW8387454.1 5-oxoprolinase subunit PxpA [Gemmatales bacterium]
MPCVDLNADLGEGFPHDAELMPLLTSVNVACGGHAGNDDIMRNTLALARRFGVQVGAHPGYSDPEHFGRRELDLSDEALRQTLRDQVFRLKKVGDLEGVAIRYLKPHGALYNRACREGPTAEVVIEVAREMRLALLGLPGSELERAAKHNEVRFVPEGFADRRYRTDGSLVPRSEPHALIEDPREGAEQVLWLIRERGVETICVHGDNPRAVAFVTALRQSLAEAGVTILPFSTDGRADLSSPRLRSY